MNNLINNIILMYTYIFMINIYKYILCLMLIFLGSVSGALKQRPKPLCNIDQKDADLTDCTLYLKEELSLATVSPRRLKCR